MNVNDAWEQWIERKRVEGPPGDFTDAVMERVRRKAIAPRAHPRWAAAAVWLLAGVAGLWRAAQLLGPFIAE